MDQSILADVKKSATGPAVPVVRQSPDHVSLECIEMRERKQSSAKRRDPLIHRPLLVFKRPELTTAVMENADSAV